MPHSRRPLGSSAILVLCVSGMLMPPSLHATLAENLTIGNARALSLAHAVTADPPGIDSVHFNPAGLARLEGRQLHTKLVSSEFSIELDFGGYTQSRADFIADRQATGIFPEDYFHDEALYARSETADASVMWPTSGLIDLPFILAPMAGVSWAAPGSDLTFATNLYSPLMVGFHRNDTDPGRFIGERLGISVITYFSPSVAWRVNDRLSIGGTLTFDYVGIGMDLPFRTAHVGIPILYVLQEAACNGADNGIDCRPRDERIQFNDQLGYMSFEVEDNVTLGFNLGVLYEITPELRVGAVYQSPVRMDMKGDFRWENGKTWNQFQEAMQVLLPSYQPGLQPNDIVEGHASIDMTLPEHFAVGVHWQMSGQFAVNADYKFTRWSRWKSIPLEVSQPIDYLSVASLFQPDIATTQSVKFPLGLQDTWNPALGLEYRLDQQFTLRTGIERRPSSIPREARSPLLPIGGGNLYSVGFGYMANADNALDVGLAVFRSKTRMPGNTSHLGNSENPALVIYNPYQGTDITARMEFFLLEMAWQSRY